MIRLRRVYDEPRPSDGFRVLVDRVWPRGLKKEQAAIDHWLKEVAPSAELRRWFSHEPAKWHGFRERYAKELDERPEAVRFLVEKGREGTVTLLFGAKDVERNNAVALKEYLEGRQAG